MVLPRCRLKFDLQGVVPQMLRPIGLMLRPIGIVCALLTMISSASAHEGHGHPDHQTGIMHYVVNPSHAIQGLLICIVALTVAFLIRQVYQSHSAKHK